VGETSCNACLEEMEADMQGDWRRSVYAFLAVGLLFALVSYGDDSSDG